MSDTKNAKDLIEQKLKEMPNMMYGNDSMEMTYKYTCMSTGMMFETYGKPATYSPFTGGTDIEPMMDHQEAVNPGEYMKPTGIPPSQANPQVQTPLAPNPVPPAPPAWQNQPWAPNPAPDAQATIGATQAAPTGYVPYPQQSMQPGAVPPHQKKKPGEKT